MIHLAVSEPCLTMTSACVQFMVKVPLPTLSNVAQGRGQAAGRYLLSYMDDSMLIGRAQTGAGTFIFERANEADLQLGLPGMS
jgi:hypothetical protein